MKGVNRATLAGGLVWAINLQENKSEAYKPCVFLSHKSEDKPACREIADYLSNAEIDYYLDELDDKLQKAVEEENAYMITECLKRGISRSTHMIVVISEKTFKSPWIPFEVGFGHAEIIGVEVKSKTKKDNINLAILTLKEISNIILPDFLQTSYEIRGVKSLNEYIAKISGQKENKMLDENKVKNYTSYLHPLDDIMNWEK